MGSHMERNIVKEILRDCYPRKLKPNENFIAFFTVSPSRNDRILQDYFSYLSEEARSDVVIEMNTINRAGYDAQEHTVCRCIVLSTQHSFVSEILQVQLLLLDPNWGITENFMNSRSNVQNLVKYVISELETNDTKMLTLKMQFYFTCNLQNIDSVPRCNRHSILERLEPLKTEILTGNYTDRGYDVLRRNIAIYVTFVSGLGNPGLNVVLAEVLAALRSIMSDAEAMEFTLAPNHTKEIHLEQLRKILCGIRLFNKDSDKGGAGIENLPHLLDKALQVVKDDIQLALVRVMERVNLFTTVVDKCYVMRDSLEHYTMKCEIPIDVEPSFIDTMKGLLLINRQNELFIRNILELMDQMEQHSNNLYQDLDAQLRKTHKTVHMRLAVPVDIIFPLFVTLSDLWCDIQDQVIILSKYKDIITNLETYSDCVQFNLELLELLVDNINNKSLCDDIPEAIQCELVSENKQVEIISLGSFANPDQVKLQYLGFCCWKLVETNGGLIPGNTSIGIAKYQNKYFAFSTPEACVGFCKKPGEYINYVLNLGRKQPEFIRFLGLMEPLQQVIGTDILVKEKNAVKVIGEQAVQFETSYVQPPHIEHKYKWNIWDLKREALLLANLSNCKTRSTQTLKNHSTQSIRTQTYLEKTTAAQTMKDNYTNVPKPTTFIFGLRGRRDDKQFSVNVTRSIEK